LLALTKNQTALQHAIEAFKGHFKVYGSLTISLEVLENFDLLDGPSDMLVCSFI
jgi:hypothetical protein